MNSQQKGKSGEENLLKLLRTRYGRRVKKMGYDDSFDLLVDDIHVEVKTAQPQTKSPGLPLPSWNFNIHRHGKLPENQPDCYVLRLEDIPYSEYPVHLLLLAPVTVKTISISFRALLNQEYYKEKLLFTSLTEGKLVIHRTEEQSS